MPVLADSPDHVDFATIREGNSPNHGRRGQNVLFGDSSVRWLGTRRAGPHDPDILSQQRASRGPAFTCTTRSWFPARCRSTVRTASAQTDRQVIAF